MSIEYQKMTGEKLYTHYAKLSKQCNAGYNPWSSLTENRKKLWNLLAYDIEEEYNSPRSENKLGKIRGIQTTFVQRKPRFVGGGWTIK